MVTCWQVVTVIDNLQQNLHIFSWAFGHIFILYSTCVYHISLYMNAIFLVRASDFIFFKSEPRINRIASAGLSVNWTGNILIWRTRSRRCSTFNVFFLKSSDSLIVFNYLEKAHFISKFTCFYCCNILMMKDCLSNIKGTRKTVSFHIFILKIIWVMFAV